LVKQEIFSPINKKLQFFCSCIVVLASLCIQAVVCGIFSISGVFLIILELGIINLILSTLLRPISEGDRNDTRRGS